MSGTDVIPPAAPRRKVFDALLMSPLHRTLVFTGF